jgi:hypothetical protein
MESELSIGETRLTTNLSISSARILSIAHKLMVINVLTKNVNTVRPKNTVSVIAAAIRTFYGA